MDTPGLGNSERSWAAANLLRTCAYSILSAILTVGIASLVIFLLIDILPGDPAQSLLGVGAQESTLEAMRTHLGLNDPWSVRYIRWISGFLSGDGGVSLSYGEPVYQLIAPAAAVTIPLALMAIVESVVVGVPLGFFAASRAGSYFDTAIGAGVQFGLALPGFWLGIVLVSVFAVWLPWFHSGGFPGWSSIPAALDALILPSVTLAVPEAAILVRVTRTAILQVTQEDYIRQARAKGLSRKSALWRHGFRNASIYIVTIFSLQISFLVAGSIVVESVFYLPGLGRMLFHAVGNRDTVLVKSLVLMFVIFVIVTRLFSDVVLKILDPRLRDDQVVRQ